MLLDRSTNISLYSLLLVHSTKKFHTLVVVSLFKLVLLDSCCFLLSFEFFYHWLIDWMGMVGVLVYWIRDVVLEVLASHIQALKFCMSLLHRPNFNVTPKKDVSESVLTGHLSCIVFDRCSVSSLFVYRTPKSSTTSENVISKGAMRVRSILCYWVGSSWQWSIDNFDWINWHIYKRTSSHMLFILPLNICNASDRAKTFSWWLNSSTLISLN